MLYLLFALIILIPPPYLAALRSHLPDDSWMSRLIDIYLTVLQLFLQFLLLILIISLLHYLGFTCCRSWEESLLYR